MTARISRYAALNATCVAKSSLMAERHIQSTQKIFVFKQVETQIFVTLCMAELLRNLQIMRKNSFHFQED